MEPKDFAALLREAGYAAPIARSLKPGTTVPEHSHDFHAKVLVTAGSFTITKDGIASTYLPGDLFSVPMGYPHAEMAGPEGVGYLAGRCHPTG